MINGAAPFVVAVTLFVFLLLVFPQLVLYLPQRMG